MLCTQCKLNEAVIDKSVIKDGQTVKVHLCNACYNKVNKNNNLEEYAKDARCKFCNTSLEDMLLSGYVGCEECYYGFIHSWLPIITNIHEKVRHVGKFVSSNYGDKNLEKELIDLNIKLQLYVDNDEYEKASQVKKQINELKEKLL